MTAALPLAVQEAFHRFVTCELTTIDASGRPITWPVTPFYTPGGPHISLTTGLGWPKKARDARREPRVALLFSDSTGSGIAQPSMVLVQGRAEVDDSDLDANRERYARDHAAKLGRRAADPPPPGGRFDWYFTRIYIHVRPERVYLWRGGDCEAEPELFQLAEPPGPGLCHGARPSRDARMEPQLPGARSAPGRPRRGLDRPSAAGGRRLRAAAGRPAHPRGAELPEDPPLPPDREG